LPRGSLPCKKTAAGPTSHLFYSSLLAHSGHDRGLARHLAAHNLSSLRSFHSTLHASSPIIVSTLVAQHAASPQLASHAMPSLHLASSRSELCLLVVRINHSPAPTLAPSHRRLQPRLLRACAGQHAPSPRCVGRCTIVAMEYRCCSSTSTPLCWRSSSSGEHALSVFSFLFLLPASIICTSNPRRAP
jgi:hypothetical protein